MRRPSAAESRADTEAWREALLATLRDIPDVPVFLSGGMDSMSIVAGLVELGRKPVCVTYRVDGWYSEDMAVAYTFTTALGLPFHRVILHGGVEQLQTDAKRAVKLVGTRKTRVECAIPMLHLAEYAHRALKASHAIVGDPGIIEDIRLYQVGLNASGGVDSDDPIPSRPDHTTRELRRRGYGVVGPGSAAMREASESEGVTLIGPYAHEPIASLGLGLDPYRINYPKQKGIALRAFPDVFGTGPRYRYWKPNKSLQTASGLSEALAKAFRVHPKSILRVYHQLAREP